MNSNQIRIFDTTLRDGEQSPGASLTSAEKLEIARFLARMGVDVIEAGFPAASPDDLEAVRRIALEVGHPQPGNSDRFRDVPVICGLARADARRYRCRLAGSAVCRPAAHPHLHGHFTHPHALQTAHGAGAGRKPGKGDGRIRQEFMRRYRIFARGRRAQRARVPVLRSRRSHPGRGNHAQYPRYCRLHDTRRVRPADCRDYRAHTQA